MMSLCSHPKTWVRLAKLKGVIMEDKNKEKVFKALDEYFKDVNKVDIPSALENLVGQYVDHADLHVDWIEIY